MSTTKALGDWGEKIASEYLVRKGCVLVEQNLRFSSKELDLVVYDGEVLVFVEVKTRATNSYGTAIDMIGRNKLRNIKYAAMGYLQRIKPTYKNLRFDAIAIDVNRLTKSVKIMHYKDII